MTNYKLMSDQNLLLEFQVLQIALEGENFIPDIIKELKVRGLVDQNDQWTQKAIAEFEKIKGGNK